MNVWAKMITALRGEVNEAGERLLDGQALAVLDQEVREAAEELRQAREALAGVVARQKLAQQQVASIRSSILDHESYAVQALDKHDQSLALALAEKISGLEDQLRNENATLEQLNVSLLTLRPLVKSGENNIRRLKQQLDTVRATDHVQRAQAAVAQRHGRTGPSVRTALQSLELMRQKQEPAAQKRAVGPEVATDPSDQALLARMKAAGIVTGGTTPQAVLERLKKKGDAVAR